MGNTPFGVNQRIYQIHLGINTVINESQSTLTTIKNHPSPWDPMITHSHIPIPRHTRTSTTFSHFKPSLTTQPKPIQPNPTQPKANTITTTSHMPRDLSHSFSTTSLFAISQPNQRREEISFNQSTSPLQYNYIHTSPHLHPSPIVFIHLIITPPPFPHTTSPCSIQSLSLHSTSSKQLNIIQYK